MNHTVLGFNKQKTHFEVIESEDIATAWLVMGNEQGINTVCHNIPNGTVATMFQGKDKKTVIELVSPNGDTITRTSGRVDAKRVMKQLKDMGIATYNIKKGGSKVKI
jgi:acylphosphatase